MAIWRRGHSAEEDPSVEKTQYETQTYVSGGEPVPGQTENIDDLHRGLKARHITMIGMFAVQIWR